MTDHDESRVVDHGVGEPDHLQRLWTPYRMNYLAEAPMKGGSAASTQPQVDGGQLPVAATPALGIRDLRES